MYLYLLESAVTIKFCCLSQSLQEADIYFFQLSVMNQKMGWKTTENVNDFIIELFYSIWHMKLFGGHKQIHVIHVGSGLISELVQGFDSLPQNCGLYVMYL